MKQLLLFFVLVFYSFSEAHSRPPYDGTIFNFKNAINYCEKAIEKDPENVEYLYVYAEILGKLGETEKSKKIFRRGI